MRARLDSGMSSSTKPSRTALRRALIATAALLALTLVACAPSLTVDVGGSVRVTATATSSGLLTVRVPAAHRGPIEVRHVDGSYFRIPPGHFPPPGACRVWHPNRPPGQQPRPGACHELERRVPAGAYLVYG